MTSLAKVHINSPATISILNNTPSAVDCGSLTVPNGQVSTSSGTTFMNTATYTCDDGYSLNGASDRTCQANGNWDPTVPTCDRECFIIIVNCNLTYTLLAVDCGPLTDAPINGAVDTPSGTTFMNTATYTCNTGYALVGGTSTMTRTCQGNGMWSGTTSPTCESKDTLLTTPHKMCPSFSRHSYLSCPHQPNQWTSLYGY